MMWEAIRVFKTTENNVHYSLAGKEREMLWTFFVILLIMWLLGLVNSYMMGGVVHVLLVIAVIGLFVRLVRGRRIV
jgi:hypothetical protein